MGPGEGATSAVCGRAGRLGVVNMSRSMTRAISSLISDGISKRATDFGFTQEYCSDRSINQRSRRHYRLINADSPIQIKMHPPSSSDVDSAPSMFALLLLMLRRFLSLLRLSAPVSITHHPTPATLTRLSDSDPAHKFHTRLDELLRRCPSLTGSSAWFTPTFWLARSALLEHRRELIEEDSGHAATIYCTIAKFGYLDIGYSRQLLRLPDGGTISLDLTPAASSVNELPEDTPILVTLHGLTGGSHESYCIDVLSRVTRKVERGGLGWRGVVVNFRGCAGTEVTGLDGVPKKLYQFVSPISKTS